MCNIIMKILNKMRGFDYLILILMFTSCIHGEKYEGTESFTWNDFTEVRSLQGTTLSFDSLVMCPTDILVRDSILLLIDKYEDRQIQLYNLDTMKKIGSRINSGQGPNDVLQPIFMGSDNENLRISDMVTSRVLEYSLIDFIKNEKTEPLTRIQTEKRMMPCVEQMGNDIYGYIMSPKHQIAIFDTMDGKLKQEIVEFPESSITYTDTERMDAYYMNFATNDRDRLAVCYSMTDLISFYRKDGTLIKQIHGPEGFFPYFKEIHHGEVVTSSMDRDRNRDAYFSPVNVGNQLFVLFDGEHVSAPDHDMLCEYILTFTWDGIPQMAYKLDDPVFAFTVDAEKRKIYGISNSPEYHIIEFTY